MKNSRVFYYVAISIFILQFSAVNAQPVSKLNFKGVSSGSNENTGGEPDPSFAGRLVQQRMRIGGKEPSNTVPISGVPNGLNIMKEMTDKLVGHDYQFTLLPGHKYMLNDCLGIKVSAGEFRVAFKNPSVTYMESGIVRIKLQVDKIAFTALKLRMRPRSPDFSDPNPCHFSGKFELGGEGKDISVTVMLEPIVSSFQAVGGSMGFCFLGWKDAPKVDWIINALNFADFTNTLDNVLKDMVIDGLHYSMVNLLNTSFIDIGKSVMQKYYEACGEVSSFASDLIWAANDAGNSNTGVAGADIKTPNPATKESAEKWTLTPNNLKGSTGRILFDNPEGSTWTIYVYTMAENKYVTSYAESNNKGVVALMPGSYKFTINDAPVLNVPVMKGHDTKLKCGTLDIVSEVVWYLYDATGKISYTSGARPTKMPLPVGTYKLDLGGQSQIIVIKNGEILEM